MASLVDTVDPAFLDEDVPVSTLSESVDENDVSDNESVSEPAKVSAATNTVVVETINKPSPSVKASFLDDDEDIIPVKAPKPQASSSSSSNVNSSPKSTPVDEEDEFVDLDDVVDDDELIDEASDDESAELIDEVDDEVSNVESFVRLQKEHNLTPMELLIDLSGNEVYHFACDFELKFVEVITPALFKDVLCVKLSSNFLGIVHSGKVTIAKGDTKTVGQVILPTGNNRQFRALEGVCLHTINCPALLAAIPGLTLENVQDFSAVMTKLALDHKLSVTN